jgi:hypothetical protein
MTDMPTSLLNMTNIIGTGMNFNGTANPVGGLPGTFGGADLLGIFGLILIIAIGIKYKATPDLLVLAVMTMLSLLSGTYLPEWSYLIFLMGGGVVFVMGLLNVIRHR